jgi:hypothetical protein
MIWTVLITGVRVIPNHVIGKSPLAAKARWTIGSCDVGVARMTSLDSCTETHHYRLDAHLT